MSTLRIVLSAIVAAFTALCVQILLGDELAVLFAVVASAQIALSELRKNKQ